MCITEDQLSETAFFYSVLDLSCGGQETGLEDHSELDALSLAGVDQLVCSIERDFNRLLDKDVFGSFGGSYTKLGMRSIGRADVDHIEPWVVEERFVVVKGLRAVV